MLEIISYTFEVKFENSDFMSSSKPVEILQHCQCANLTEPLQTLFEQLYKYFHWSSGEERERTSGSESNNKEVNDWKSFAPGNAGYLSLIHAASCNDT